MNNLYRRAYTEVLEIINHLSEEELKKIPKKKLDFYEKNKDQEYNFTINPSIDLEKQNISPNANAILVSLYRDYFATEKQKKVLKNLLYKNQERLEREKYQKYNPNNIFAHKVDKNTINNSKQEVDLVEIKNKPYYRNILDFFKSILKK